MTRDVELEPESGTARSRIYIDPRDRRLDANFFRRILMVTRLYWWRRGSWLPWLMLGYTFAISAVSGLLNGWQTMLTGQQTNAIVGRHVDVFWSTTWLMVAIMLGTFVIGMTSSAVAPYLVAHWRKWLTTELIDRYLEQRSYYDIVIDQDIDNPDQRIQEEVGPLCENLIQIPRTIFSLGFSSVVQISILLAISVRMTIAVMVYVVVHVIVSAFLYRPGIAISWDTKIAEADLRYGILNVRDNAETIAFYGGEAAERKHLGARIQHVIRQAIRKLVFDLQVQTVLQVFRTTWFILPFLFVVPLYLNGKIEFGAIAQASTAAFMISNDLSNVINLFPTLTSIAPNIVRVAQILEKTESLKQRRRDRNSAHGNAGIEVRGNADAIRLDHVSYETPGGELSLVKNISLQLQPGSRMLIVGQTGVGKSSFLRVLAGLWTRGSGVLDMPSLDRAMFMPQKPYMTLGSLRSQILYPMQDDGSVSNDILRAALDTVRLPHVADRNGGMAAERDWGRILSLGEQQRIGFARVIVNAPEYVFLDEATSAVDQPMEAHLYGLLLASGATIVSVAHRASVIPFHDSILDLREDGWSITPVSDLSSAPSHSSET